MQSLYSPFFLMVCLDSNRPAQPLARGQHVARNTVLRYLRHLKWDTFFKLYRGRPEVENRKIYVKFTAVYLWRHTITHNNNWLKKVKLNPGFPCKTSIKQEEGSFHQQIGLTIKEETNKLLHLEYTCSETWTFRKVDQKYLEKFWHEMLEKDGEDQLDRSCEKLTSVTETRRRGESYM